MERAHARDAAPADQVVPQVPTGVRGLQCREPGTKPFMHGGHGGQTAYDEHAGHRGYDRGSPIGAVTKSGEVVEAAAAREDGWAARAGDRGTRRHWVWWRG